jgi:hypothetical protein
LKVTDENSRIRITIKQVYLLNLSTCLTLYRSIDFGNVEEKKADELMVLPLELGGQPPFAHLVHLPKLADVENSQENMDALFEVLG